MSINPNSQLLHKEIQIRQFIGYVYDLGCEPVLLRDSSASYAFTEFHLTTLVTGLKRIDVVIGYFEKDPGLVDLLSRKPAGWYVRGSDSIGKEKTTTEIPKLATKSLYGSVFSD